MWWSGSGGLKLELSTNCFDTVGLVIWPVKIVPEMTYYVSSGTLNPTHSLTHHLQHSVFHKFKHIVVIRGIYINTIVCIT